MDAITAGREYRSAQKAFRAAYEELGRSITELNESSVALEKTVIENLEAEETPEVPMPDFDALPKPKDPRFQMDGETIIFLVNTGDKIAIGWRATRAYGPNDRRWMWPVRSACLHAIDAWERETKRMWGRLDDVDYIDTGDLWETWRESRNSTEAWREAYEQFLKATE